MLTKLIILVIFLNHVVCRKYADHQNTPGLFENNANSHKAAHREYQYDNENHKKLTYQTLTKEQLDSYKNKLAKEDVYTEAWENAKNDINYLQVLKDLQIPKHMYEPFIFCINNNAGKEKLSSTYSESDIIDPGLQDSEKYMKYYQQNEEEQSKNGDTFIIANSYNNKEKASDIHNPLDEENEDRQSNENENKLYVRNESDLQNKQRQRIGNGRKHEKKLSQQYATPSKTVIAQEDASKAKSDHDNAENVNLSTIGPSSYQYFYNYVPDVSNVKDSQEVSSNIKHPEDTGDKIGLYRLPQFDDSQIELNEELENRSKHDNIKNKEHTNNHKEFMNINNDNLNRTNNEEKNEEYPESYQSFYPEDTGDKIGLYRLPQFDDSQIELNEELENRSKHDNIKNKEHTNNHKEFMNINNDNLNRTNNEEKNEKYPESYQSFYSYISPKDGQSEGTLQKNKNPEINFETANVKGFTTAHDKDTQQIFRDQLDNPEKETVYSGTKNKNDQYKLIREIIINHKKALKSHHILNENVNHMNLKSNNEERNRQVDNKNSSIYSKEDKNNNNIDIVEGPHRLVNLNELETESYSKNNHKNQEINYNLENARSQYINKPRDQNEKIKKSLGNNSNYSDGESNSYVFFYRNIAADTNIQVPMQNNKILQTDNKKSKISGDDKYYSNDEHHDIINANQPKINQSHNKNEGKLEDIFIYNEGTKYDHLPQQSKSKNVNTEKRKEVEESLSSKYKNKFHNVFNTKEKDVIDAEYYTGNGREINRHIGYSNNVNYNNKLNINEPFYKQSISQNDEFKIDDQSNNYYLEKEIGSETLEVKRPLKNNYIHKEVSNHQVEPTQEILTNFNEHNFKYEDRISGTNYKLVTEHKHENKHVKSSPILYNVDTAKNRTTAQSLKGFPGKSASSKYESDLNNQYQEPNLLLEGTILKSHPINQPTRNIQPSAETYQNIQNLQNFEQQTTEYNSDLKLPELSITNEELKSRLNASPKLRQFEYIADDSQNRKNQRNNINNGYRLKHRQSLNNRDTSLNNGNFQLHNHYNYEAEQQNIENTKFIPIRPRKLQRRRKLRRRNRYQGKQNQSRGHQHNIQKQIIEGPSVYEETHRSLKNKQKIVDVQNTEKIPSYKDATINNEMTITYEVTTINTLSDQFAEFGKKLVPKENSPTKFQRVETNNKSNRLRIRPEKIIYS